MNLSIYTIIVEECSVVKNLLLFLEKIVKFS